MENLWTGYTQGPIELQLDILDEVACEFDVAGSCGMPRVSNVIVLHDAGGIEVGDKGYRRLV
jgi:hypothetical protein